MPGMSIRRAIESDGNDITRMGKSFFDSIPLREFASFSEDSLLAFADLAISKPNMAMFMAEDANGKVVGSIAAVVYPLYLNQSVLVGQEVFWWVDPEARRTRAGKMLKSEIEAWAKSLGASVFIMCSIAGESADRVGRLYSRSGYKPTEHYFARRI